MRILRLAALAQNDMGFRVVRVPSPSALWAATSPKGGGYTLSLWESRQRS